MATREQVLDAIRNADAAGDGESVRKLAAYLQTLDTQKPVEPDRAELERRVKAGEPLGVSMNHPFARELTQRNAQQQQGRLPGEEEYTPAALAQKAQGARDTGAGVMEGLRLLKGGAKQLSAQVQDAWGMFTKGTPYSYERVTRGLDGQVVKREKGLRDDSRTLPVIATELVRQQVQQEVDRDRGINIPSRDVAAGATQLGSLAIGPELALPKATTLSGAMLKNSAAGGIGNAAMFDAEPSALDAGVAVGAGPVLATLTGLVPATKNMIGRALRRASTGSRTAAARDSAQAVLPNVEYSLAQRTGIPELVTLERRAFNDKLQNFYADQTDKFVADTVKALKQPMKAGQTLENDFINARTQADRALKALKLNASNSYERGIKEAKDLSSRVTMGGQAVPVPTPEFGKQVSTVLEQARGMAQRGLQNPLPEKYMRNLEKVSAGGAVTPKDLADVLQDLTLLQKDTSNPVAQALASRMRGALDNDLDALEAQLGASRSNPTTPAIDDSLKKILDTRSEYRRAMEASRLLSDSASYKLLGVGEDGADASDLLAKLKGMNPEKRNSIRTFMEQNSPDLLVSMKDAAVRDAVARAGTIRAAADSQQSLSQLTEALFDPKTGFDIRTSGIWNADELTKLEGIKDGLRTISNNRPNMGGAGTPITPEDTAINIISQHAAFVARYLTRVLMSRDGARFFADPRVYERMSKINRSTTGSASNMVARAALLDLLQTDYSETGETIENVEPVQ